MRPLSPRTIRIPVKVRVNHPRCEASFPSQRLSFPQSSSARSAKYPAVRFQNSIPTQATFIAVCRANACFLGATAMATTTQDGTRLRKASHGGDWIEEDASILLNDTSIDHRGLSAMKIDDDGHDSQPSTTQSTSHETSTNTHGEGGTGGIRLSGMYF